MSISKLVVYLLLSLVFFGLNCTYLEFDKMAETTFPEGQLINGKDVTLSSIYWDAGVGLWVEEDDESIDPLFGGETINSAELDLLMATYSDGIFPLPIFDYYLYGVVVNYYKEDSEGLPDLELGGEMFRYEDRGAFAIFYKQAKIQSDPEKYLRTAAHEIGHAFNLHHEDGDGATTLMNQDIVVQQDYIFEFSETSVDHLKNHPESCSRPGKGWLYAVHEDHPNHGACVCINCDDCDEWGDCK